LTSIEEAKRRAEEDARSHGYYLTPDSELLRDLLEGLVKNEKRYGYPSCPCRLAAGKLELDRDIICPCDYPRRRRVRAMLLWIICEKGCLRGNAEHSAYPREETGREAGEGIFNIRRSYTKT